MGADLLRADLLPRVQQAAAAVLENHEAAIAPCSAAGSVPGTFQRV
jgi:hypothetical protein